MDKIIDTFYNGSIQNNNYNKSRLKSNKFSSPNLLENKYNRNNNYSQRYENGQRIMLNSPVPRTQYSMGLQAPTITGRPPTTHYSSVPYQTVNPYSTLKKNYPENIFKMNILNNRIQQLEEENKRDRYRIQRLMEGSTFAPEENNNFNRTVFNSNPNYINNPASLDQAINNLRNPYLSAEELAQKQALRREQVQFELDKARQRINEDRMNNDNNGQIIVNKNEKNYTISNYSDESEEEDDESSSYESFSKKTSTDITNYKNDNYYIKQLRRNERKKDLIRQREMNEMENKVQKVLKQNYYNNEELNNLKLKNEEMLNALKSKEEAEDFINNIPDHVALQLQNDNFKMRSNINSIKEGFKEIRNDLENKLEALEMKQNLNFEVIRKIIENGGNKKINAGLRKYLDGEEVDLNNIQEDFPEFLRNIPALIDQKIQENEERKREEKNKLLNEEINKKYDMMEYKYGYANSFYGYKNKYQQNNNINNNTNQNNNKNFVISKNYGRFQYIPNNNKKKNYHTFRQNAEQNLKIIKEKENKIPGAYAYGVGNKNMDRYIPIKMNGCFDDWYKAKKNGKNDEEFQIIESQSEVGINAIKKRVNSKSDKSEKKSEKSKKSKKKSEKTESVSVSKSKSSKEKKNSKKEKSESNSKKSKKGKKSKKSKETESEKNKESNEEKEDEDDEEKNEESENKDSSGNKDSDDEKKGSSDNKDSNEENEEDNDDDDEEKESNDDDNGSGSKDDDDNGSGSKDDDDNSNEDNESNSQSGSKNDKENNSDKKREKNSDDDDEEDS